MEEGDQSGEEDQSMLDEESSYGDDQWSDDWSNTDIEEDPYERDTEPVPPETYQDEDIPTDWSRHEADLREDCESDSWHEEAEVKNSPEISEEWEHETNEDTQFQMDAKEDSWESHTIPDTGQ